MSPDILRFPGLGIEFPLDRVAFRIGNFNIYWYGITFALAFLFGVMLYLRNNRRCGIHPDEGLDVILWSMVGAVIGARLYYVIFDWESYRGNLLKILNLREGGLAIYGGIIGALIVGFIVTRKKKLPMLAVTDAAFPGVLLGQAIGRWGNFFNMEAFGGNTTLPWGMTSRTIQDHLIRNQEKLLSEGMVVDPMMPVHPTFFYESLWNVVGVLILMLIFMRRRRYDGEVTLAYTAWYGFGRFFIEGLRTDSLMWGPVRVSQALGGFLFVAGLALLIYFNQRGKRPCTLEYIEGQKKNRFGVGRYVDTEESRERIAEMDRKLEEKKTGKKKQTKAEEKGREDGCEPN